MATTIYNYQIYCVTEAQYVYEWSETLPTTCPNNTAHTIDTNSITIVETLGVPRVLVDNNVVGYYQASCVTINVGTGATGTVFTQNFSFPHDIYLWTGEFRSTASMIGDTFSLFVAPYTTIGYLTVGGVTGDTVLHVSPIIFTSGYIVGGINLSITNGVTSSDLGRVADLNSVGGTATVEFGLPQSYSPGALVQFSVCIVRNQYIDSGERRFIYGAKGFSTRKIPKNQTIRFVYTNNNTLDKMMVFNLEYNFT